MPLPNEWLSLLGMVYTLGLKHGMDPDHLATIDGIARTNASRNEQLARWSGFLFSAGHGGIVILLAIGVSVINRQWQTPAWLDTLGAGISVGFLYALGLVNLYSVLVAPANEVVAAAGLKSRLLGRFAQISHPALIVAVGALFALSFDTLSLVALFSLAASSMSGLGYSVLLAGAFMLGMMTTDGVNGFWVAKLVTRADRRALVASRAMGFAIAGLSLLVGSYGLARFFFPAMASSTAESQLLLGCAAVAIIGLSFLISLRLAPAALPTATGARVPNQPRL